MSTEQWELAACRDVDPEVMFPVAESNTAYGQYERELAKSVCRNCPIRDLCLMWALDAGQRYGVWGGMTEEERRMMRRQDILVDTS